MSVIYVLVAVLSCLAREADAGQQKYFEASCYSQNFSDSQLWIAYGLRSGLSALSVLLSIPVICLRVYHCYRGSNFIRHVDRLMIYACSAVTFYAVVQSFQLRGVSGASDAECVILAAFAEYASISVLTITACIGVHLALVIRYTRCLRIAPEDSGRYRRQEMFYVILAVFFPLLFVPWPFINQSYGLSGAGCWIAQYADGDCATNSLGHLIEVFALYYFWALLVLSFSLVVVIVVITVSCLRRARRIHSSIYVVLLYMALFCAVLIVGGIVATLFWYNPVRYPYLIALSCIEPLFTLLSGTLIIAQMCRSLRIGRREIEFSYTTILEGSVNE